MNCFQRATMLKQKLHGIQSSKWCTGLGPAQWWSYRHSGRCASWFAPRRIAFDAEKDAVVLSSRSWDHGAAGESLWRMDWIQLLHGRRTTTTKQPWTGSLLLCTQVAGKYLTSVRPFGTAQWRVHPPSLVEPPQKRCSQPGVLGSSENLDGFHLWHPQFLRVVIASHVGDRLATIAKVVDGVFAVNAKVTPRHRAVCTRSMVAPPGWSSHADRWRSFGLLLMVMFGTWGDRGPASATRRQSPIRCAEDNDVTLPLQESQGSPSRKRTSATPTANTALEVVAEKRVRAWRQAHHMEREEDFAWAFATQEAAVLAGGHCLAEAWLSARARQEAQVLPVAAEMAASLNPRPTIAPELRIRAKPKAWGKLRRRPVRLRENTSDAPDAINRRVFALTQVFASLGALKPEGTMTSRLQREWEQSCQRLSQQLVTNAETITIQNAIQTATELNSFMEARGRGGTPCHVDLDAYLHCKEATTAPCRALNSLRWLCKHGQLGWDVSSLVAPTSRSRKANKTQALVVLPPMFPFLEERVEQLWQVQDVRWSSLLASWIVGAGCLRYKHVQRSVIRKLSKSTIHCKCTKGKQARQRTGFSFCLPAVFNSGFPWAPLSTSCQVVEVLLLVLSAWFLDWSSWSCCCRVGTLRLCCSRSWFSRGFLDHLFSWREAWGVPPPYQPSSLRRCRFGRRRFHLSFDCTFVSAFAGRVAPTAGSSRAEDNCTFVQLGACSATSRAALHLKGTAKRHSIFEESCGDAPLNLVRHDSFWGGLHGFRLPLLSPGLEGRRQLKAFPNFVGLQWECPQNCIVLLRGFVGSCSTFLLGVFDSFLRYELPGLILG